MIRVTFLVGALYLSVLMLHCGGGRPWEANFATPKLTIEASTDAHRLRTFRILSSRHSEIRSISVVDANGKYLWSVGVDPDIHSFNPRTFVYGEHFSDPGVETAVEPEPLQKGERYVLLVRDNWGLHALDFVE